MAENVGVDTTHLLRLEEDGEAENDQKISKRPKEPCRGDYVKSIVYAGFDAIVTCFSLISSMSASHLSSGKLALFHFIFPPFKAIYSNSTTSSDHFLLRFEQQVLQQIDNLPTKNSVGNINNSVGN